jgi:streptomycin 6-kinase
VLKDRIDQQVREWDVEIERVLETETSVLAFGSRGDEAVVLKVLRAPGDEWHAGAMLEAFDGKGAVRVLAHAPGAVLMERLVPGTALVSRALEGQDDLATEIIADVIRRMSEPSTPTVPPARVEQWGKGFERYLATGDTRVPAALVERAQQTYQNLAATQQRLRLLHGDLQHYNILFDESRGWVAIDPKGVVGEVEYEIGACLRNPVERPELFASRKAVERRLRIFAEELALDTGRALEWAFSQAVLSALWSIEDGELVDHSHPALKLAQVIESILE